MVTPNKNALYIGYNRLCPVGVGSILPAFWSSMTGPVPHRDTTPDALSRTLNRHLHIAITMEAYGFYHYWKVVFCSYTNSWHKTIISTRNAPLSHTISVLSESVVILSVILNVVLLLCTWFWLACVNTNAQHVFERCQAIWSLDGHL